MIILMLPVFGFKPEHRTSEYLVIIGPDSHISVNGRSNVNRFSCDYAGIIESDTLSVITDSESNNRLLSATELSIKVGEFDCGMRAMTRDMITLLREDKFPFLNIQVTGLTPMDDAVLANTLITLAGETVSVPVYAEVSNNPNWSSFSGEFDLSLKSFGLEPPTKFFGAVRVKEDITIKFHIYLIILQVA